MTIRCTDCQNIIVAPDTIDGKPGIAGQLRAKLNDPDKKVPQVTSTELTCSCGSCYMVTVAKVGRRSDTVRRSFDDRR